MVIFVFRILVLFLFVAFSKNSFSNERIIIKFNNNSILFPNESALKNLSIILNNIEIQAYPEKKFTVKGIKLCKIIEFFKIKSKDLLIKIIAKDNFYAYIGYNEVTNCDSKIIPYILIQENVKKWPYIQKNHEKVGKFSLAWIGEGHDKISQEKWVRNISKIEIFLTSKIDLEKVIGNISLNEKNGYKIFLDNCAGCHSLNLIGQRNIGPDLNYPLNPTEYYSEKILRKFIRDPQSVRYYRNAKMEGFSTNVLSDNDLDELIIFFNFLKHNKNIISN